MAGFGLIIGSFLNVCIHRLPRGESVVRPRSRCPGCGRPIGALENIPVFSYLLLAGKCSGCGEKISWVYPAVEAITAVTFLLLFQKYLFSPPFFVNAVFCSLIIVLVFIDLFERILPDVITLSGIILGFLISPLQSGEFYSVPFLVDVGSGFIGSFLHSFIGILVGGGFLWLVAYLYFKVRKIEGMGFGDVKMMAMVGAFLGWQYAWMTILLGSLTGALIGGVYIYLLGRGSKYELPFGSFLGLAAVGVTLWGPALLNWYVSNFVPSS